MSAPILCAGQQDTASRVSEPAAAHTHQNPLGAVRNFIENLFAPREPTKPRDAAAPHAWPRAQAAEPPAVRPSIDKASEQAPAATAEGALPAALPAGPTGAENLPFPPPAAAQTAGAAGSAATVPAPAQAAAGATGAGTDSPLASTVPSNVNADAALTPASRAGVALILPAKSSPFGRAADVVRQGFMAARGVASDKPEVRIFETDGSEDSARDAVAKAVASNAAVIVGPLTKADVGAILKLPLTVPTLVLNTPDGDAALPRNMFALSLNTESEARAAAAAAFRNEAAVAVIVTTTAPLARRAAAAFADAWTKLGGSIKESVEFTGSLGRVRQAVDRARGDVVFLAADAERARLLRPYLGRATQVIATSQVFAGVPKGETQKAHDLNGMRFFDMPWLHQPDHAAAMVFPRAEGQLSADLERLYALGIDAFRIAGELALARTEFLVDGVTGNLNVQPGVIGRAPLQLEYRDGTAKPLAGR